MTVFLEMLQKIKIVSPVQPDLTKALAVENKEFICRRKGAKKGGPSFSGISIDVFENKGPQKAGSRLL